MLPVDYSATLEAAAALGARYVNAICDDPDLGRLSDSFAALTAAAAGYGIRAVVEFMAYRSVRTLAAAVAIAAASDGGGVLVDALHVQRCGVRLDSLRAVDPALISYLQVCDAPLAAPGAGSGAGSGAGRGGGPGAAGAAVAAAMHEARAARLLPGEGELPLRELLEALPDGIAVAVEAPQSGDGGVGVGGGDGGGAAGAAVLAAAGAGGVRRSSRCGRGGRWMRWFRVLGPSRSRRRRRRSGASVGQARGARSVKALRRGAGAARRQLARRPGRGARGRRRQRRGQVDDAEDPVRRDLPLIGVGAARRGAGPVR